MRDFQYGETVRYNGAFHAVANVFEDKVWLISLEQKDAVPFFLEDHSHVTRHDEDTSSGVIV